MKNLRKLVQGIFFSACPEQITRPLYEIKVLSFFQLIQITKTGFGHCRGARVVRAVP